MTVSTTATRIAYTGNASTTAFAFSFRFLAGTDIAVYLDGVLQSTGYTVSTPGASGTVTFSTAPASGVSVVITRATAKTQETDYVANDAFSADATELAFDRAMLAAQDNAAGLGRALRVADYEAAVSTLPPADERANLNLVFGADGAPGVGGVVTVSAASEAQAEAATDNGTYMTPLRTAQAMVTYTGLQPSDQPVNAGWMMVAYGDPLGTYIDNVLTIRNESYYATTTPADGRTAARGNAALRFTTAFKQERGAVGYSAPAVGFDPFNLTMGAQFISNVVYLEASNLVGASQPDGAPDILLCVTMAAGDPFFPGTFFKPFEHDSSVGTTYLRARQSGGGYGTLGFEGNGVFGNIGFVASCQLGMGTTWARLRERVATDQFSITTNLLDGGAQDNAAKSSWSVAFGAGQDAFKVSRSPAGSGSLVDLLTVELAKITAAVPVRLPSYIVAGLPSAATAGAGAQAYCSNETGGAVPVFSDGTNWRRVTDRAIAS